MFAAHRRSSQGKRCRAARMQWRRRLRGGGVDRDDKSGIMFRMLGGGAGGGGTPDGQFAAIHM